MSTPLETSGRPPENVRRKVDKLRSLHDGELAVLDVVGCGHRAIPALRELLFERDPSGLFEVRRRAVEALKNLGAFDVLIEFLSAERNITDPVERLGEDAVINAAALALTDVRTERAFQLLLRLARRPCLTGVIAAIGNSGRREAIPLLVEALAEDGSRLVAENALRKFGVEARAALAQVAYTSAEPDSESRRRQRISARKLLENIAA